MRINTTSQISTLVRLSILAPITLSLTYCGAFKERSAETRQFMEKSDIAQLNIKKSGDSASAKKTTDDETSNDLNEETSDLAKTGSSVVLSSKQMPGSLEHKTWFLTENENIAPLRDSQNQPIKLEKLEELVEKEGLNMPSGSDLGSYIFHHKVNLNAQSIQVRTLPESAFQDLGIQAQSWKSGLSMVEKDCGETPQPLWIRSNMQFELNNFSFQDFTVSEAFLDTEPTGKSAVTFKNLNGYVQSKLLDAFNPNLKQVKGNTNSYMAVCPSTPSKIWKFDGKTFVVATSVQNEGANHQIQFRHTIPSAYLKNILLNGNMTLLDVTMGENYRLFQRPTYRHEEKLFLPMQEIVKKIQSNEVSQDSSNETPDTSFTPLKGEPSTEEVSDGENYTELQKKILQTRKKRSLPARLDLPPSHQQGAPTRVTEISVGTDDAFQTQKEEFSQWNSQLKFSSNLESPKPAQDTIHSLVLKRHSKIFYSKQSGKYFDDPSLLEPGDDGKTYTPNSLMWNDELFRGTERSNQDVQTICANYPLSRKLAFSTNIHPPKELSSKTPYITVGSVRKSIKDVVLDQFYLDSEGKKLVGEVIWYGAMESTPMKNKQDWEIQFCMDPESGKYQAFWKSNETEKKWNPSLKWKKDHIHQPSVLIDNEKPWIEASQQDSPEKNVLLLDSRYFAHVVKNTPPQEHRTLINRRDLSPTQIKLVCSETTKKCFAVFQVTARRALDPRILAYYLAHPDKTKKYLTSGKALAPDAYNIIINRMTSEHPEKIRKNELMIYGAFELDSSEEAEKEVEFISLQTLKAKKIYSPNDPEILHDVDIYFPGETADLYLGGTVK